VSAPLTLRRKLFYAAILSGALLTLLLGGLELGLRLAGYGASPHFFRQARTASGELIWRENRDVTVPYFSAALARRPQPVRLPAKKPAGTYRLFVLGSSAAMGDPEPSFSLARVLDVMLAAAYPDQHFEVVNTGITAINSHLVRGIADDCAALEPDLFIVYEGNNEVIGPFGPTGVFAPFLKSNAAVRAAVWLKGTRTAQLLGSFASRGRPREWGGMEMFLQQRIEADDPRLHAVRDHFRANLEAIVASGRRGGGATLLCTVATNQRDFAPFLSTDGRAQQRYDAAQAALGAGDEGTARREFQAALDLDALRFRTDSKLNQAIGDVVFPDRLSGETVDAAGLLAAQSRGGVCGNEFFYEHVHLTLRGTYALARALLPRIAAVLHQRDQALPSEPKALLPYEDVALRLGFSTYEQSMIAAEMLHRLGQPPFTAQSDHAARLATWQRAASQGQALLARPDATDALREISRRALAQRPDDWILARNTGAMLLSRQRPAEALPLLEQADRWIDDDVDTLVALGWTHRALGHAAEAEAAFARARKLEPDYPNLPAAP